MFALALPHATALWCCATAGRGRAMARPREPPAQVAAAFDWRPVAGAFLASVAAVALSSRAGAAALAGAAAGAALTLAGQALLAWVLLAGFCVRAKEAQGEEANTAAENALARAPGELFADRAGDTLEGELAVIPEGGWAVSAESGGSNSNGSSNKHERAAVGASVEGGVLLLRPPSVASKSRVGTPSKQAGTSGDAVGAQVQQQAAFGALPLDGCKVSLPESRTWSPATPIRVEHPERTLLAGARALLIYAPTPPAKERWYLSLSLAAGGDPAVAEHEVLLDEYGAYFGHVRAMWRTLAGASEGSAPLSDSMFANPLLARVFFDLRRSPAVIQRITDKLNEQLAKLDTPAFVDALECTGVDLGAAPPVITGMHAVDVAPDGSCMAEMSVKYLPPRGAHARVTLSTCLNPRASVDSAVDGIESAAGRRIAHYFFALENVKSVLREVHSRARSAPLSLEVHAYALEGRLRLRVGPPPTNQLWISFVDEPRLALDAIPTVGDTSIRASPLCKWIVGRIKEEVMESMLAPAEDDLEVEGMLGFGDQQAAGVGSAADLLRGARSELPTSRRWSVRSAELSVDTSDVGPASEDAFTTDDGALASPLSSDSRTRLERMADSAEAALEQLVAPIEKMVSSHSLSETPSKDELGSSSSKDELGECSPATQEAAEDSSKAARPPSPAVPTPTPSEVATRPTSDLTEPAEQEAPREPPRQEQAPQQRTSQEEVPSGSQSETVRKAASGSAPQSVSPQSLAAKFGTAMRKAAETIDKQTAARYSADRKPAAAEEIGEKIFAGAASFFAKAAEAAEDDGSATNKAMKGLGGILNSLDIGGDGLGGGRAPVGQPRPSGVTIEELDDGEGAGEAGTAPALPKVPSGLLSQAPMQRD